MKMLKKLFKNEEGQTLVEYGLIIALIAVLLIVALTTLKNKVKETFEAAGNAMPATT